MQDISSDRESLYLSLYDLYHTPEKIKDDKIIYILQQYRRNRPQEQSSPILIIYTPHTHTHTHIYIYGVFVCVCVCVNLCVCVCMFECVLTRIYFR